MVLSVADWVGKLKVNILLVLVFHGIHMWIKGAVGTFEKPARDR